MARKTGAELLVAKLDRLSRRVSFIAQLMEDPKVRFRVASMPHADNFQLHIHAALSEQERSFISLRTKAALQAAKAKGVKLGGYRPGAFESSNAAKVAKADLAASKVINVIRPMREQGMSLRAIANELNGMGLGSNWSSVKVLRTLNRLAAAHQHLRA